MSVLVGKQAPDFTVPAVLGNGEIVDSFTLSSAIIGKYGLVFFYPLDFTFVCPTEIIDFSEKVDEFKKLNAEIVGVSVDSEFTHLAWINTLRNEGGLGKINYPLLSDLNKEVSQAYGVLGGGGGSCTRAYFTLGRGVLGRRGHYVFPRCGHSGGPVPFRNPTPSSG